MKSPESYEKADIDKFLKSTKAWFFSPMRMGMGQNGVPDRVGVIAGRFFSIEVKRPGKEPTPIQTRRMAEIELRGGKTFWGTAAKVIPEMEAWLAQLG